MAPATLPWVSGPSLGRDLAVTSYTATGTFRWRSSVSPTVGTMAGGWVVAASNGDIVAVGYYVDFHGFAREAPWSGLPPMGRSVGGWTSWPW